MSKLASTIIHTIEALLVLGVALYIAHSFPEQRMQAFATAFTVMSLLSKGARVSGSSPVPDYVNDFPKKK